MLAFLFDSGAASRKKALRKNQRDIQRLIRDLDRERAQLERNSSALSVDLKKYAKEQNMTAMRTVARSIVRNRAAVTKLHQIKSQLQAVSLRMAEVNSQQAIGDAMRGTTRALASLNRRMLQSSGISESLREFERQKEFGVSMDDIGADLGEEDLEEEETDLEVERVMCEATSDLVGLAGGIGVVAPGAAAGAEADDGLPDRLQAVQRGRH